MRSLPNLVLIGVLSLVLVGCGAEDRKEAYFKHGMELMHAGDPTRARLEFKNALKIDPKYAPAWFQLGEIDVGRRDWAAAYGAYSRAVELDSHFSEARLKRGQLLSDGGRTEDALADAEAVLAEHPDNPDALALRGAVRGRQGKLEEAANDAKAALEADPVHRDASLLLAEIRRTQGASAQAVELLERAVQAHPEDVKLRMALARAYHTAGKADKAREQLEKLVALEPSELGNVMQLVAFLKAQGDKDAAREALQQAVDRNPDQPKAKLLLVDWTAGEQGVDAGVKLLEDFIAANPRDYQLQFALAEMLLKAGRPDDAGQAYRDIIERDGTGTDGLRARNDLAALRFAQQRDDEASALLSEVLAEDARNAEALILRASIALKRKDPNAAVPDLRDALQNEPHSLRALRLLAKAHEMRGEIPLAQDALEKAVDAAPKDAGAYLELAQLKANSGDVQGASEILEDFLQRAPEDTSVQTALAKLQLSQQDWAAMEKTAQQILKTKPDHPLGFYLKGLLLQREGKYQESVEQFELALEKRPDAFEPLLAMARSYLAMKQVSQAEQSVRAYLEKHPANGAALSLLGDIYAASGRNSDAVSQLQKVVSLYPKSPSGYVRLAELYSRSGDKESAISTLRTAVAETDRNAYVLFRLGVAQEDAGQTDAAIRTYEDVLKLNPHAQPVANNLAMLLANKREDDPASLARATELTSDFADSNKWVLLDTLGWVQFRNGDLKGALVTLEKAAGLVNPAPPEMQYHLGVLYAQLGRSSEAKAHLSDALAAKRPFPGREDARRVLESL